eukprot:2300856-Prymnesium_polylepis.1
MPSAESTTKYAASAPSAAALPMREVAMSVLRHDARAKYFDPRSTPRHGADGTSAEEDDEAAVEEVAGRAMNAVPVTGSAVSVRESASAVVGPAKEAPSAPRRARATLICS